MSSSKQKSKKLAHSSSNDRSGKPGQIFRANLQSQIPSLITDGTELVNAKVPKVNNSTKNKTTTDKNLNLFDPATNVLG